MHSKTIAKLAFIFLGILALIDAITLLTGLLSTLSVAPREDYNRPMMIFAGILPLLLMMSLAIYLISRSSILSVKHFPNTEQPAIAISETDIKRLAFACLGVFFLISSIPGICRLAVLLFSVTGSPGDFELSTKLRIGEYVGVLIQLGIGIYLVTHVSGWQLLKITKPDKGNLTTSQTACPNCGHPFSKHDYDSLAMEKLCSKCGHSLPDTLFIHN